jgi:hypothetical protein
MENQAGFLEDRFVVYEKLVKINFAFLTEDYGLRLSNIEKADGRYITLNYLSERVFFNLYYGPPSFELDFNIGRVGIEDKPDNEGFTSGDLICFSDDKRWAGYKLYSAHSYENLHKSLPKLAELLKVCGASCLKGDALPYEKVLFEKKRKINQWCNEQELKQAKKAASVAWENKDYTKFIEIFEPVINSLSPSEKKKLEYAHKHL